MTETESGPRLCQGDTAQKPVICGKYSRESGTLQPPFQAFDADALAFGADVLDAEVRLVSAGWHDPERLWNAAAEHGLTDDSFSDPKHAFVFRALLAAAWHRVPITVEDMQGLARHQGVVFPDAGYPPDLEALRWTECCAAGVESFAAQVAANARRIAKAQEYLRLACEAAAVNTAAQVRAILRERAKRRAAPTEPKSDRRIRSVRTYRRMQHADRN